MKIKPQSLLLRPGKACKLRSSRSIAKAHKGQLRLSISKGHYKSGSLRRHLDKERLTLLREFQKCDLYSKVDEEVNMETALPYYQDLLKKYFPSRILNW